MKDGHGRDEASCPISGRPAILAGSLDRSDGPRRAGTLHREVSAFLFSLLSTGLRSTTVCCEVQVPHRIQSLSSAEGSNGDKRTESRLRGSEHGGSVTMPGKRRSYCPGGFAFLKLAWGEAGNETAKHWKTGGGARRRRRPARRARRRPRARPDQRASRSSSATRHISGKPRSPNVRRDAPDIARRFQALGLKTELLQDAGGDAMRAAVEKFRTSARGAGLAAFYFAGHGVSWSKQTYVVPVDVDLSDPRIVQSLVPAPSIEAAMAEASHPPARVRQLPQQSGRRLAPGRGETRGFLLSRGPRRPGCQYPFAVLYGPRARGARRGGRREQPFSPLRCSANSRPGGGSADAAAQSAARTCLIATQGRQVLWDQNTYQQPFPLAGSGKAAAAGAGHSSWAGDPSRIVELPKAYALARQSGLFLPEGLIAHRAAAGTPHAQKIGSYRF